VEVIFENSSDAGLGGHETERNYVLWREWIYHLMMEVLRVPFISTLERRHQNLVKFFFTLVTGIFCWVFNNVSLNSIKELITEMVSWGPRTRGNDGSYGDPSKHKNEDPPDLSPRKQT
jgi:hypothetical protein